MAPSKRSSTEAASSISPSKKKPTSGEDSSVLFNKNDQRFFQSKSGAFNRQQSSFRNWVKADGSTDFKPELNRYHLYVSLACPWAHRTLLYRSLKGLEDVISVSTVHYLFSPEGWRFKTDEDTDTAATKDDIYGSKYIKEVYHHCDPNYNARFTVPVLFDKKNKTIVNNESSEIIRMLNSEFNEFAKNPKLDLYPEELRSKIDELNTWIYDDINNGVYKTGFATKQEIYEENYQKVFNGLDRVEKILSKNKYLTGSQLTEADIRLFTTIVRFDPVYHTHFKCTGGTIAYNYPHILKWLRRVYQTGDIKSTVNMEHIKKHYYMSHIHINPTTIVPVWDGADLNVKVD